MFRWSASSANFGRFRGRSKVACMINVGSLFVTAVVLLVSLSSLDRVDAAYDQVPACSTDAAAACCQNAVDSVEPSACNWNLIMPIMTECVRSAVKGCSTLQILRWEEVLKQFNTTLYRTACASTCPDPDRSAASIAQCFVVDDTVINGNPYTNLADIVTYILQSPSATNQGCPVLNNVINCLNAAAPGCSALMDQANQRLQSINATLAVQVCNGTRFVTPSTSRPLAIFNSVSVPQPTVASAANQDLGSVTSDGSLSGVWIALIVVGTVLFISVVIVIGVLAQRTIRYRREFKNERLLNYSDENRNQPGWRLVSSKKTYAQTQDLADWPRSARPRGSRELYYRAS